MPLKAIDFFSDGGVTCGFKQVGIEVIGGIDIDPACKETYERNNRAKYLCADVSNLNVKRLIDGGIVNAKYYGVPQNRKWYMLVATRVKHKIALPIGDKNNIYTVKDAIGDKNKFKPIEQGQSDSTSFMHSSARLSNINLLRIKNTMHDGGSRETWPKDLWPKCYFNHDGHTDFYGRMHWDKPSPTITTRFVSYSNGRYGHPEQDRAISIRERATSKFSGKLCFLFKQSREYC